MRDAYKKKVFVEEIKGISQGSSFKYRRVSVKLGENSCSPGRARQRSLSYFN